MSEDRERARAAALGQPEWGTVDAPVGPMTRPPRQVSRLAEATLAASLSVVGLATVVLRLLADPTSRLSQWVDRALLPEGITR